MVRKTKHDIEIQIVFDSRENNIDYLKYLLDSRITKDGIKFVECVKECVKPLDKNTGLPCKISTTDLTFRYREKDSNSEWINVPFGIELKKKLDIFSSLYLKKNRDNLYFELQRCVDYGISLYFISTNSYYDTLKQLKEIKKFNNPKSSTNIINTHFEQLTEFTKKLSDSGYGSIIISGNSTEMLAWTIKRCIKHYIAKNKLQMW